MATDMTNQSNEQRVSRRQLAEQYHRRGLDANNQLRSTLQAIGALFGPAVLEALHRAIEPAVDQLDMAADNYRQAIDELGATARQAIDEANRQAQLELAEAAEERVALLLALAEACEYRDKYAARLPKATPPWYRRAKTTLDVDRVPF